MYSSLYWVVPGPGSVPSSTPPWVHPAHPGYVLHAQQRHVNVAPLTRAVTEVTDREARVTEGSPGCGRRRFFKGGKPGQASGSLAGSLRYTEVLETGPALFSLSSLLSLLSAFAGRTLLGSLSSGVISELLLPQPGINSGIKARTTRGLTNTPEESEPRGGFYRGIARMSESDKSGIKCGK